MQTILSVPTAACLIVDYKRGLQVPAEEWPRLQKGLQRDTALPWDVLLVGPAMVVGCIKNHAFVRTLSCWLFADTMAEHGMPQQSRLRQSSRG